MTLTGARPDKAFWLSSLRREAAALRAAAADEGALTAKVPSCPDWRMADLVAHTGADFRWIAGHVARGTTDNPGRPDRSAVPAEQGLLAWWDEGLATLLTTLDSVDPTTPAWNWAPQAKVAGFWHRRCAHEIAVHRWDAQVAVGLPEPVETALAVDGVDEVLDSWLPSGGGKGPGAEGMVQLIASDAEDSWIVRIRGAAISLLDTATLLPEEHHLHTQATGTASDLLLALYGRLGFDILEVSGDPAALTALRVG